MVYLQQVPQPLLRPWIRTLWYCRAPELPHRRERVLPDGCTQIILSLSRSHFTAHAEDGAPQGLLPGAVIVGPRARYSVVDTAEMEELAGIAFEPAGFAGLFRERADQFFEQSIALEDVWAGSRLTERLREVPTPAAKLQTLELLLAGLLCGRASGSELVRQAMHLFREKAVSVGECARSTGVSQRRLSQVFREQVGMGPKMWCRIHRFQAAVQALHRGTEVPWAELALACGYYDQSHFANDFHAFSGINPTTYATRRGRWQNHVPLD